MGARAGAGTRTRARGHPGRPDCCAWPSCHSPRTPTVRDASRASGMVRSTARRPHSCRSRCSRWFIELRERASTAWNLAATQHWRGSRPIRPASGSAWHVCAAHPVGPRTHPMCRGCARPCGELSRTVPRSRCRDIRPGQRAPNWAHDTPRPRWRASTCRATRPQTRSPRVTLLRIRH